jgi:photosystem II PsbX protein
MTPSLSNFLSSLVWGGLIVVVPATIGLILIIASSDPTLAPLVK